MTRWLLAARRHFFSASLNGEHWTLEM